MTKYSESTYKSFFYQNSFWNKHLLETEHFFVVPSIGSIVPGWVLIVSKDYYLSMRDVPENLYIELNSLKKDLSNFLSDAFNSPVVCFEHGPAQKNSGVGCTVDHFHLHLVPLNDTYDIFISESKKIHWEEIENLPDIKSKFSKNLPYLYLEFEGDKFIHLSEKIQSQFFRRIIASISGKPNEFNWRDFQFKSNAIKTIEMFDLCLHNI